MLTAQEQMMIVGGIGEAYFDGLLVRVRVNDVRTVFGRTDYNVTPVAGSGEARIIVSRVRLDDIE